jgi:hypothetical protein
MNKNTARAKRFVSALEDLLETGMGCDWEIEHEVKALGSEEVADFVQKASRACGTLGDMAANILLDAEVRLPVPTDEKLRSEDNEALLAVYVLGPEDDRISEEAYNELERRGLDMKKIDRARQALEEAKHQTLARLVLKLAARKAPGGVAA